jgi:hypothetical protein
MINVGLCQLKLMQIQLKNKNDYYCYNKGILIPLP